MKKTTALRPGFARIARAAAGLTAAHLLLAPRLAVAHGIQLEGQDAAATARGEAFSATADNASAIYYNPAGITQIKRPQFRSGIGALTYQTDYSAPSGSKSESRRGWGFPSSGYFTMPLQELPLSIGLGLYSPFGLSMKWPETTGFRSVAIEGSVLFLTLQPVIAWQITPEFSVGVGPTINYARTELKQGLSPFAGNDFYRFRGDAIAPGFSAGILWQPVEKHSFAVVYRSGTTVDYSGHTELSSNTPGLYVRQEATAKFQYPQQVTAAWSWRPAPEWNFEVDATWTGWSSFSSVQVKQAASTLPLILDWRSSWRFGAGLTRKFRDGWRASAGYAFAQNSEPDAHYTPLVPDTAEHLFNIGVGRETEKWSWDLAFQVLRGMPRTVSGSSMTSAGQSADGHYDWWSESLSISVGRKF